MVETTRCADCDRLEKLVQQQSKQIAELTARVAQLERQLAAAQKNSRTSSKPPSSDIVSPPAAKKRRQPAPARKPKSNQRVAFEPEMIDRILNYHAEVCPCCGGALQAADDLPVRVHQHAELPQRLAEISEHRLHPGRCTDCGQMHYPALPEQLAAAGLVGPRLTALVGFLKGPCHASYSAIRKFFRDVVGVRISRGLLAKLIAKTTAALADPYEELRRLLTDQAVLNVDGGIVESCVLEKVRKAAHPAETSTLQPPEVGTRIRHETDYDRPRRNASGPRSRCRSARLQSPVR